NKGFPVPAPRKAQPRKEEQQVNNVPPTASAIEAAASNVDVVENGIHEEEESKNKRVTLKHKSKVLKKVKLHHKKKAAEAKKYGINKKHPRINIHEEWPVVNEHQELNTKCLNFKYYVY
ncbi:hypothetical protein Tco_0023334, partial [Tanacetum coccineum]